MCIISVLCKLHVYYVLYTASFNSTGSLLTQWILYLEKHLRFSRRMTFPFIACYSWSKAKKIKNNKNAQWNNQQTFGKHFYLFKKKVEDMLPNYRHFFNKSLFICALLIFSIEERMQQEVPLKTIYITRYLFFQLESLSRSEHGSALCF